MLQEKFTLRLDRHEKSRASSLVDLWKKDAFLDVTIVCDDDQIDAHKLILSAASPLFQKMLLRNQNLVGRPLLYLKGTRRREMENLLEFVYRGEVNVHAEDLQSFMKLANSLEVEGLVGDIEDSQENFVTESKPKSAKNTNPLGGISSKRYSKKSIKKSLSIAFENISEKEHESSLASPEEINQDINLDESSSESFNVVKSNDYMEDQFPVSSYDEIVQDLVVKTDKVFNCRECPYTGGKTDVLRHVERHIKGFVFTCDVCQKTFERRETLRIHMYRCSQRINNSAL